MDDPGADLSMLERTYLRFEVVNRLVSRPGLLYRRDVRPRAREKTLHILDVGAGGGDLCRMLARRLRRDGLQAEITALDADARAVDWAEAHDAGAGVRYVCADSRAMLRHGERFDIVLSNHLLHHLTEAELAALLDDSRALAGPKGLVLHRDIARGWAAYLLFAAATLPFAANLLRGSFIREDGLISIRRSYRPRELAAVVPPGWRVRWGLPSRLELRWEQRDGRS